MTTNITTAEGATDTSSFKTWQEICPLRFVYRNGARVLQSPHQCLETKEIEWHDVPLMEE